jgi:SAM-dependent methyltransferase
MAERVSFDRVADVYDETRALPPTVLAKAVGVLAEALQGKRVLEVGVGTGRFAVPLQKSGIRVVGVDIAPKMVKRGLEKGMRDVVFADGARLPFRNASFDAATSSHVLHLVADWRGVLREVVRVVRPWAEYFTIIERHRSVSLSDRYRDVARGFGYVHEDIGFHERDFPALVPPSRIVRVAHHMETVPADRILAGMDRKELSFLWRVPAHLHPQIMSVLRAEYGGRYLDRSFDLEIAFWTREQVTELAKARA